MLIIKDPVAHPIDALIQDEAPPYNVHTGRFAKTHQILTFADSRTEKTEYTVSNYRLIRTEPVRRFQLLCIRHPQSLSNMKTVARSAPPLLPILAQSSGDHSSEAVLLPYADPPPTLLSESSATEHQAEALAHLLNLEGPWHLAGLLKVPLSYLHVSHKHPTSFVTIKHSLKIFLRVEKGEDEVDPKTGRKKQFDIIIETPINVLSVSLSKLSVVEEVLTIR